MSYTETVTFTGSNGDAATGGPGNTGADTMRQGASAGTLTISTAHLHSPATKSLHATGTTTSGLESLEFNLPSISTFEWDGWFYVAALPASGTEITLVRLLDSTPTAQCKLGLNGLGALVLHDTGVPNLFASLSGKRLSAGNMYRVIYDAAYGASGTQRVQLFDSTGASIDDSGVKASNNGPNVFSFVRFGSKADTTTATSDLYFSSGILLSGTTTAEAHAGSDQTVEPFSTVTLNATGSGTGTWSLVSNTSGHTPTLSDATALTPTYTAPGDWCFGSTQTWRYTLTGGSPSDDVVINILPATLAVIRGGVPVALKATKV